MKLGGVYYRAWVYEGAVEIDTYVLRTIRGRFGYLVEKNEWTWVKTGFGQRATWGWAKRIYSGYRTRFVVENGAPKGFTRSKPQAVRIAIQNLKRNMADFRSTDSMLLAEDARDLAALERRLKHEIRKVA